MPDEPDPEPESEPEDPEEDPSVLTPDDLRIEDDETIEKIGEHRYVVDPGSGSDSGDATGPEVGDPTAGDLATDPAGEESVADPGPESGDPPADPGPASGESPADPEPSPGADTAREPASDAPPTAESDPERPDDRAAVASIEPAARRAALDRSRADHAVDVVLKTEDRIVERRVAGDDRLTVFEEFLTWYARQIDDERPPAATISALLAQADLGGDR